LSRIAISSLDQNGYARHRTRPVPVSPCRTPKAPGSHRHGGENRDCFGARDFKSPAKNFFGQARPKGRIAGPSLTSPYRGRSPSGDINVALRSIACSLLRILFRSSSASALSGLTVLASRRNLSVNFANRTSNAVAGFDRFRFLVTSTHPCLVTRPRNHPSVCGEGCAFTFDMLGKSSS
jgi:hypothetical protein